MADNKPPAKRNPDLMQVVYNIPKPKPQVSKPIAQRNPNLSQPIIRSAKPPKSN